MGIVSRAIPTLLRGVSQASDSSKQPDHADIQDNADSNPVVGLVKRSGIQYITNLSTNTLGNVHIQTINRDIDERYVAIFSTDNSNNGDVKIYKLDGTEITVNKPDGTTYLNTSDPRNEIKTVTIADFTFVVNTSVTTEMDTTVSDGNITQAIIFIKQVSNDTVYSVTVDGVTVTDDTTNDSSLSTAQVATDLANGLSSGLTGFNVSRNGSVVRVKKTDGSDFSIDGNDTQGNTQLQVVKNSVQRFTDLPTVSPNGYIVEVKGDDQTNFDNYYVKFVTNNGNVFEEGQWEETVEAGIKFKFNYSTMPHVLLRQADGEFRLSRVDGDTYGIIKFKDNSGNIVSPQVGVTVVNGSYAEYKTTKDATYIQDDGNSTDPLTAGDIITITSNNHGLSTGDVVKVEFTSGQNSGSPAFTINNIIDNNKFSFSATTSFATKATSGNCNYSINQSSTAKSKVTITKTNHGFNTGDLVDVLKINGSLTSGQFIIEKIDNNNFFYTTSVNEPFHNTSTDDCAIGQGFSVPKWGERTAGDEESAPDPSFINSKINNVFFFRNRLGFLADDNVILSEVSEFFKFFPDTVLTITDSHPIDVAASHTKVAILKHAVTMGEKLVLFSEQTQFILSSSADNLTPTTANVLVTTEFESSAKATPVGAGSSIYFLTTKGAFAGIREYIQQSGENIRDAANITIHIPRLIPSNIFKLAVSNNQDILVCLGTDNPNKLFINRWLFGGQGQKVLNSWFTFTINPNRRIKNIDFIGTDLFMVIEEDSVITLEKIPFETEFKEPNSEFEFHLDHKVTEAQVTVEYPFTNSNGDTINKTRWTLPYRLRGEMNVVGRYLASGETSTFIDSNGTSQTLKPATIIQTTNLTNGSTTTIEADGDYRNAKVIIGEPYEMHYRFSKQELTETPQQNSAQILSSRLQLHHFYIKFEKSGFFQVEVTPENRDTSTHKFSGRFLGAASSAIGTVNLETGTFRVPIMSRADKVDIDVKNKTFLPTLLASAEYEAMFNMKSRRM